MIHVMAWIGSFIALVLGATVCFARTSIDPMGEFATGKLQQMSMESLRSRAADRRLNHLQDIRAFRAVSASRRSLAQAAGSHDANLTELPEDPSLLFGDEVKCLLQPGTTEGPFFIDGQEERKNITDGEEGIDLFLHLRLVDVNTCMPVEGLLLDAWHANAAGSYSGVQDQVGSNYLRGMVATDADGIAIFHSIYPGHYIGRCHHIHLLAWKAGTESGSNLLEESEVLGIGQIYFDEDLNTAVNLLPPYNSTSTDFTTNEEDGTFQTSNSTAFDPIVYYTKVGETLSDGIFAWITIGVDLQDTVPAESHSTLTSSSLSSASDGDASSAADTESPVGSGDTSDAYTEGLGVLAPAVAAMLGAAAVLAV